ncbi:MAG TPA: NUDIX hydrolase [Micromonosporaceae bacterium]
MTEPFVLPARLIEHARRFYASGQEPVTPRVAATVVLLRPAEASGFEVYAIRRAAGMAFAAGMYAFPGGSVEPGDPGVPAAAVREVAEETGVRLDPDALVPWARWVTPEFEPRRYDTYFFLARMPADQRVADPAGEADHAEWVTPTRALERLAAGAVAMLPPTAVTLRELAAYPSIEAALSAAAGRDANTPVQPRLELNPDGGGRLVIS